MVKRFQADIRTHGVSRIIDNVSHKKYMFIESEPRNIRVFVELLNDVIE